MKILFVIRTLEHGGGAERLMYDIYCNLKQRKNLSLKMVVLLTAAQTGKPTHDYFEKELENDKNVIYPNWKMNLSILGSNDIDVAEYKKIVDEFCPDIIHSHLYQAELLSREYIYPTAKYFTHVHDNIYQLNKFKLSNLLSKSALANLYEGLRIKQKYKKVNNYFISISRNAYNFIEQNVGPKNGHNILLFNAINYNLYHNSHAKKTPNGKVNFVCLGTIVEKKNQAFLVDVMVELKKLGVDFELNLLGRFEPYSKVVQEKILESKLENSVFLRGNITNTVAYLHNADMYLHAATYEPFGLVLLEAMAAGLPIVTYDGQGNKDIIEDGKNGFILSEPTPKQFADKINYVLKNANVYDGLSEYAKSYAKAFDIDNYCNQLLKIYEQSM